MRTTAVNVLKKIMGCDLLNPVISIADFRLQSSTKSLYLTWHPWRLYHLEYKVTK